MHETILPPLDFKRFLGRLLFGLLFGGTGAGSDLDITQEYSESEDFVVIWSGFLQGAIRRRDTDFLLRLFLEFTFGVNPCLVLDDFLDVNRVE